MPKYHLRYSRAARHALIIQDDEPHNVWGYDWVASFSTRQAAEAAMEELRGETRWAVWWDQGRGLATVRHHDELSGPSAAAHARITGVFDTRGEAEEYAATL